jgi:N-sulfoglucosamine sulfohydrolase
MRHSERNVQPNILYVHSHDTGRYVQPYGHPVPTPTIQRLADQGLLFRQAFCAAPTCSGSRACLLTGQWAHSNGMIGLAHRGFELHDYGHHLVRTLRDAGYWTGLIGEQHLSRDPGVLGYDHVADIENHHVDAVAPAARRLIEEHPSEPFFLSIGFFETHREYFAPTSVRDSLYSLPPANLPDTPETRRDIASYKASARSLDHGVGAVLNALDEQDLADQTVVILTTDHGRRCCPTSTTARPRTCWSRTAGPTGRWRASSSTTCCSIPPRPPTSPAIRPTSPRGRSSRCV